MFGSSGPSGRVHPADVEAGEGLGEGARVPRPPKFPPNAQPKQAFQEEQRPELRAPQPPICPPPARLTKSPPVRPRWADPEAATYDSLRQAASSSTGDANLAPLPQTEPAQHVHRARATDAAHDAEELGEEGPLVGLHSPAPTATPTKAAGEGRAKPSAAARPGLRRIFELIDTDRSGSISKLDFIGAVAKDPLVAALVVQTGDPLPVAADSDEERFEKAVQVFDVMRGTEHRISYEDLAAHMHTDEHLRRRFNRFDADENQTISKLEFIGALARDASLSAYVLPGIHADPAVNDDDKFVAAVAAFNAIAGQQGRINYDDFALHFRRGAELRTVFSRMDLDCDNMITKLEMIGAVAMDPTVALYMLPDSAFRPALTDEEKFAASEQVFREMAGGKAYITYEDFETHFCSLDGDYASRAGTEGVVQASAANGSTERALVAREDAGAEEDTRVALVAAPGDQGLAASGPPRALQDGYAAVDSVDVEAGEIVIRKGRDWQHPRNWSEVGWLMRKIQASDHPLDSDPVKIADKEVRIAVWGRDDKEGPRQVVYENEYARFPYFTCVISAIQFGMYVAAVGNKMKWSGPVAGPQSLWMAVYETGCYDVRNEVWRLWSYQWVHGSLAHVIGNCIGNLMVGGELEMVHGSRHIGILYTFGVIAGGLTVGTCQPHMAVVGCSGGVYTMIGARITNLVLNGAEMRRTLYCRVAWVLFFLIYDTVNFVWFYGANTSYAAHAGGWLCGLLYGGHWLENLEERPWELQFIKWCKRIFVLYILFCIIWYITERSGRPQGLFESEGHCVYDN